MDNNIFGLPSRTWVKAEIKVDTVYAVYTNSDLTEGRGITCLVGYATSREKACLLARGKGVMSTDGNVVKENALHLRYYDAHGEEQDLVIAKAYPFWDSEKEIENIRQQALSKLTEAEKIALGFK